MKDPVASAAGSFRVRETSGMELHATTELGIPADRVVDVGVAIVMSGARPDGWVDGSGRPLRPEEVIVVPDEARDAFEAVVGEPDDADALVEAIVDRTQRTARGEAVVTGCAVHVDLLVSPMSDTSSRLALTADIRGASPLVRMALRLARRFLVEAADWIATDLVGDLEKQVGTISEVRLSDAAPTVIRLRRPTTPPTIPPVPKLGQTVALVGIPLLLFGVMLLWTMALVLGAAVGVIVWVVTVLAVLALLFGLGPRWIRRRVTSAQAQRRASVRDDPGNDNGRASRPGRDVDS